MAVVPANLIIFQNKYNVTYKHLRSSSNGSDTKWGLARGDRLPPLLGRIRLARDPIGTYQSHSVWVYLARDHDTAGRRRALP